MNVVLVHNRYQRPGGEDEVFEAESQLLDSYGHKVERFTVDNRELIGRSRISMAAATVWNGTTYRRLRAICRRRHAQVVHFHNTFPMISPAGYYAARAEGAAVVQTLHNFRLICPNALCFRGGRTCDECVTKLVPWPGVVHRCYRSSWSASSVTAMMLTLHNIARTWSSHVDAYIALSQFARTRFIAGGIPASRIAVKPNFLAPDPGAGRHDGHYALFVGRLSHEKGLSLLLSAWAALGRGMRLKIVGSGPLESLVQQDRPGVEWLGPLPRERVIELMKEAAFLIFPSEVYENCPMTLVQAFGTGLPVLASGHGSIGEMVRDGTVGRHFRPGDLADLVGTLTWAIDHPHALLEMQRHARMAFEARYTADQNHEQLCGVYRAAIERLKAAA